MAVCLLCGCGRAWVRRTRKTKVIRKRNGRRRVVRMVTREICCPNVPQGCGERSLVDEILRGKITAPDARAKVVGGDT